MRRQLQNGKKPNNMKKYIAEFIGTFALVFCGTDAIIINQFILEVTLTFLLMLFILNVSQGSKETGLFAGIAIGGTVFLEAM